MQEGLSYTTSLQITDRQTELAELVTSLLLDERPELTIKYGNTGKEKCREDSLSHLSYLAEAIRLERPEIFSRYLQWAQEMLQSRNIPLQDLSRNLYFLNIACRKLLAPGYSAIVNDYIDVGVGSLNNLINPIPTFLTGDHFLLPYAKKYLSFLLKGNRKQAQDLIDDLIKNGASIQDIYEQIFEASQYEVGLLWQSNKITVAHEHYCTAATQQIMTTLYSAFMKTQRAGYNLVSCSLAGGLHEMGIRMVSDFFEMNGWDTYYMGASMPETDIISAIKEQHADLLAISVTMPIHLSKLESLINTIRRDESVNKVKIIVGGHPFNQIPELWEDVGADGWAKNAREAVLQGMQMIGHKKIIL